MDEINTNQPDTNPPITPETSINPSVINTQPPDVPPKSDKHFSKWVKILVLIEIIICIIAISFISYNRFLVAGETLVTPSPTPTSASAPSVTPSPTVVLQPTRIPDKTPTSKPLPTATKVPAVTATSAPAAAASQPKYTISGYVYHDGNENQIRDSGEETFPDRTVTFLSLGKLIKTDSSGRFTMGDLPPGTYNITTNGFPGSDHSTTPNPAFITITNADANVDFGFN